MFFDQNISVCWCRVFSQFKSDGFQAAASKKRALFSSSLLLISAFVLIFLSPSLTLLSLLCLLTSVTVTLHRWSCNMSWLPQPIHLKPPQVHPTSLLSGLSHRAEIMWCRVLHAWGLMPCYLRPGYTCTAVGQVSLTHTHAQRKPPADNACGSHLQTNSSLMLCVRHQQSAQCCSI